MSTQLDSFHRRLAALEEWVPKAKAFIGEAETVLGRVKALLTAADAEREQQEQQEPDDLMQTHSE
jgi:hypothetical protein